MQEDKKKRIKSLLTKLLIFLILLAVSVATYKINLAQTLHNYVLRVLSSSV